MEKLKKREEKAKNKGSDSSSDSSSSSSDSESDSDGNGEQEADQFVVKDPKVRTAIRNLRQREDIAKYLRNLDPNSAVYNAKSRTMKDNPNPDLPENE